MSKQPPPAPIASAIGPCPSPTIIQISRTPRHWKFTQHLCTTRPPQLDSVVEALVRDEVSTAVSSAVNDAQNNLLSAFDQMISSKLERVKSQISENQKQLSESQISKIQNNILCNDAYSF